MPDNVLYPIAKAEQLVQGFLDCRLAKDAFTHEAHLITGLYMLAKNEDEALPLLRQNLKKFLKYIGVESTNTSGYHETMTVFWLWVLKKQFAGANGHVPWNQENVNTIIDDANLINRNLWLEYYSKELIMSVEARRKYVRPDIKQF